MRNINFISVLLFMIFLAGCAGSTKLYTYDGHRGLENVYISFTPPQGWYTYEENPWKVSQSGDKAQWVHLHNNSIKGARYDMDVETNPYIDGTYTRKLFNEHANYYTVFKDEDMELDDNDKEQGIGYVRDWINYVQGMKCSQGVFSRSPVGMMKGMSSKNYSFTCGYYDKVEGKRILSVSYSYRYAGGSVRHQKDANTPQNELISLEQAELGLKQAVKRLVSSIKIKNFDRERMEREGLMHYDKRYELSKF